MKAALLVALLSAVLAQAPGTSGPDPEGFIRNWLVLAPIAIEENSGASEIEKDFLKGEASIKPKAGDKAMAGPTELTWVAHTAPDFFIDFLTGFGKARGEQVAAYAVTYVLADDAMTAKLSMGSNDQAKVWLNGQPVLKFTETRTLEKDTDSADVNLVKGQNVVVFKVVNEVNNWQGCLRFMKDGAPVKNLKISLTPQ
ncbi:MAG: hypothetical protein ABI818_19350 [Acidobacteriota bacterium]